jgi:AAHS family 4-hydroxybenzoate transporter-like MFS transporter
MSSPIDVGRILDEGRWRGRQKLFVFLTALTLLFDGIDNQLLGVALPAIMRDWALPRGAFAPILACGMIGMLVGGAVGGVIGDRIGRRFALIGSVLTFGLLTLALAFADNLWTLGILRFVAGLGLGGALPNATALASEYVPRRRRAFAVTLTIVCVPLGGALVALVAGRMLPAFGWRTLFAVGGLLPVVAAVILLRFLPESPRYLARRPERWPELTGLLQRIGHPTPPGSTFVDLGETALVRTSIGALFSPDFRRDTLALWGAFFSCLLAVYTAFNWIPSLLNDAGLGIAVASNGMAAFNLGGVAGAVLGGMLISRRGSKQTMLGMSAGAMAGALVLAVMPIAASSGALPIIAMLGYTGGLINAVQTTMYALAAHVYPTMVRATGVGTAAAVGRTGAVISTYAGSWALDAGGSHAFFGLMAAAMTSVLLCLALVRRHVPGPEAVH